MTALLEVVGTRDGFLARALDGPGGVFYTVEINRFSKIRKKAVMSADRQICGAPLPRGGPRTAPATPARRLVRGRRHARADPPGREVIEADLDGGDSLREIHGVQLLRSAMAHGPPRRTMAEALANHQIEKGQIYVS